MEYWNKGPDTLYPAESSIASKLNEAVKLKLENRFYEVKPISVYTKFKETVETYPNKVALAYQVGDDWHEITYKAYWDFCLQAAKSFIKFNLEVSSCVSIIGFNAPPWMISLYGAIIAGGIGCGIYSTNTAEACEYVLNDSGSKIILVENEIQLEKILYCRRSCDITAIIQYTGDVKNNYNGLVKNWQEFLAYGNDIDDEILRQRIQTIAPNKCATLIYTSGTTGNPKAAMLSHDNIIYAATYLCETTGIKSPYHRCVSYLPLSHIAAQLCDCFTTSFVGATVFFAKPDALKGSLGKTIIDAKPTLFFAVPRVWEKMQDKIEQNLKTLSPLKLKIFKIATNIGYKYIDARFKGENKYRLRYWLADKIILQKVRSLLGLDEARLVYSGGAPINKKTLEFFMGLGFPICEVFGMSETAGSYILGLENQNRITSIGHHKNVFNMTKLVNIDENGNGELCMYGRHIFMGYLNSLSKTNEIIDEDGYLRSGDLAKIDDDGFLYITGRIKELIITAGGENISPIPIETAIKEHLPECISNCMVCGDRKKYLVVLVTLKSQINLDTMEPLDELMEDCKTRLKEMGSNATKVSEIIRNKNDPIYAAIDIAIKNANKKAISNAAKVQKFAILPKDFSLANGELGPTLKLRRPFIFKKYADTIEDMYKGDTE